MGKQDKAELLGFLDAFAPGIQAIALHLRDLVWDLYPAANELIYDGPAALAFGFSTTDRAGDVFCSIAIYGNKDVQFGFTKGDALSDPAGLLEGDGKHWRYIRVRDLDEFPGDYAEQLLTESYANSTRDAKNLDKAPAGQTIVRSISSKKRRPRKG
ncbi:MAG TPA: DUF1801 domain-containing protein [Pyrinomonadaceae bacterium]|nr:DUF1801 domain-containing protein [Pyrinomonadaceae bacterium]